MTLRLSRYSILKVALSLAAGALPLALTARSFAKVVSGTPQQPRGLANVSTADGNDLTNAGAATPADDAVAKASATLDALTAKLKAQYELTPDWTTDAQAVAAARAAMSKDSAAVVDKLSADPDYAAAVTNRDKLKKALDALASDPNASPTDIETAANDEFVARDAVSKMQSRAVAADPATQADRPKMGAALRDMSMLRHREDSAVKGDPSWQAAKQALDDARAAAASAATAPPTPVPPSQPATPPKTKSKRSSKAKSTGS